jgi:hypothetical protein
MKKIKSIKDLRIAAIHFRIVCPPIFCLRMYRHKHTKLHFYPVFYMSMKPSLKSRLQVCRPVREGAAAAASRKLKTSLNSTPDNIKVINGSVRCEACYMPGHERSQMHTQFC